MPIAAAYIRVSTEDQTEYSPAAQLEEILAFARKNGFSVPDEFVFADEGISGRSAEKRINMTALPAADRTLCFINPC